MCKEVWARDKEELLTAWVYFRLKNKKIQHNIKAWVFQHLGHFRPKVGIRLLVVYFP